MPHCSSFFSSVTIDSRNTLPRRQRAGNALLMVSGMFGQELNVFGTNHADIVAVQEDGLKFLTSMDVVAGD